MRPLPLIMLAWALVACESLPELPDTAAPDAQRVQAASDSAQEIHLRSYPPPRVGSVDGFVLMPEELRTFQEIMRQGRPTAIRSPRNAIPGHSGKSIRFIFMGANNRRVGEVYSFQIWSESREAEEQARLKRDGACHVPPQIVLPDAAWNRLQELPTVQKLQALWKEQALKQPAQDILYSATAEKRKDNPDIVILYLEPGQGATKEQRLAAFKELYALGENVEKRDEYNYTGLGYACALGKLDEVKQLLQLKPNLRHDAYDPHDIEECTCGVDTNYMPGYVQVALENGHKDVARYLLSHKAAPTGAAHCIEKDDISMLRELLAAGGSVHEAEHHGEPCTLASKSPAMIRFLLANGCRKMRPLECLLRLRRTYANKPATEAAKRDLFLQAGCITPHDIAEFDNGGLACFKDEWCEIDYPQTDKTSREENYDWSWMKPEEAWSIFSALAGTNPAAQDAATLRILRRIPAPHIVKKEYISGACARTLYIALRITGDTRFAAQVAKLTPTHRAQVLNVLENALPNNTKLQKILNSHPHTQNALRTAQ